MTNTQYHEVLRRLDDNGRTVVRVLLSNVSRSCELYESDYAAITEKYGLASWMFCSAGPDKPSYVRFKHDGRLVTVARLILDAPPRTAVKHRDKNTLNLRFDNLRLDHGGGGVRKKPKTKKKPSHQPLGGGLRIPMRAHNG